MFALDRLRVRHGCVLVRPLAAQSRTKGGLHTPEVARDKPLEGVVMRTGSTAWLGGLPRVGDIVYFQRYAGLEVNLDENLLLLADREISLLVRRKDVRLVTHDDPSTWHLAEAYCEWCDLIRSGALWPTETRGPKTLEDVAHDRRQGEPYVYETNPVARQYPELAAQARATVEYVSKGVHPLPPSNADTPPAPEDEIAAKLRLAEERQKLREGRG